MNSRALVSVVAAVGILVVGGLAGYALASPVVGPIGFAPGDYDNTVNTVSGTNAAPVYNNNQTTGLFRDIFWWGTSYNGGTKGVGSPDFINSGYNLVSSGGSPARAIVGPGPVTALNFTGVRTSGGASFLAVYDTTPADRAATKDVFDATQGITVSADVLFAPGNHSASAGVVALYNEGQDGLAVLASNGGGNNPDNPKVSLVFQQSGLPTTLASVSLPSGSFLGDTDGSGPLGDHWYRVVMDLSVAGDSWTVNGYFYNHVNPTDPASALGSLINPTPLTFTGSLSSPGNALDLTNPGEVGIMAMTPENFNDGVASGWTGADPHVDNVGVSVTNFQVIPEPATLAFVALGGVGLLARRRHR